jgi:predicted ATP-dependent endonuclease of OLD family
VLAELTITNFAIIERLNLKFAAGLNVLTGETGAGKSIIIDAVSMLLGGRADSNLIRAGSDLSTIEGIFSLADEERESLDPLLEKDADWARWRPLAVTWWTFTAKASISRCSTSGRTWIFWIGMPGWNKSGRRWASGSGLCSRRARRWMTWCATSAS